jgi:hypothetical protein
MERLLRAIVNGGGEGGDNRSAVEGTAQGGPRAGDGTHPESEIVPFRDLPLDLRRRHGVAFGCSRLSCRDLWDYC